MKFGDIELPVPEELEELDPGSACVAFAVLLDLLSCFRPARLVTKYSHVRLRLAQRAHVGFSLLHLTLEAAQEWQLSRSLGAAVAVDRDAWAGRGSTSGALMAAMKSCGGMEAADRLLDNQVMEKMVDNRGGISTHTTWKKAKVIREGCADRLTRIATRAKWWLRR